MIKNYILLGFRNILKNKWISAFNIFGLSLGIAFALLAFNFIEFEFSVDQFHSNKERVFLVTHYKKENQQLQYWGTAPAALGPRLKSEASAVEEFLRLSNKSAVVRYGDKSPLAEKVTFADPSFFDLLSFPLESGNTTALNDPSSIILSKNTAIKYFGNEDPLGKELHIQFGDSFEQTFTVKGVAEAFPLKKSFEFNLLMPFEVMRSIDSEYKGWSNYVNALFIKTSSAADEVPLESDVIDNYIPEHNKANSDYQIDFFSLEPLATMAQDAYKIRGSLARSYGPPTGKVALSIMALLLITLSALNYVNTATAMATSRLKEIGLRKVMGSTRGAIIRQFLTENFLLNTFSLGIGIILAAFLLIPAFDNLFNIGLRFEMVNINLWLFSLTLLLLITFLSGSYPALYVSKFEPSHILGGQQKLRNKKRFTKVLLFFQFLFAFVYIAASLGFIANEQYQKSRDWGYQMDDLLVLEINNERVYDQVMQTIKEIPEVEKVAGSSYQIGYTRPYVVINPEREEMKSVIYEVGKGYVKTFGLELAEGEYFDPNLNRDDKSVLINETFAATMGWEVPLNEQIELDGSVYTIRGVLKDFHYGDFSKDIEPVLIRLIDPSYYTFITLRVRPGSAISVNEQLQNKWEASISETPYAGFFQDTIYDNYYNLISAHGKVTLFSALVAVILSCLGLFGLVYLTLNTRLKDFSIMKVLGITDVGLIKQVLKIFIWILLIAIVIGFPLSLVSTKMMFGIVYADHVPITMVYPTVAAIILIMISTVTLASLIQKLLVHNPVNSLRSE